MTERALLQLLPGDLLLPVGPVEGVQLLRPVELDVVHEGLGLLHLDASEARHGLGREEPAQSGSLRQHFRGCCDRDSRLCY